LQVVDLQLISSEFLWINIYILRKGSLFGYVKISQTMAHPLFAHEIVEKAWTNMDALKGVS
jgi:hypothetical protein